ncbi:putative ribosome biogenesis GTPase RsgA [Clostridium liquoris]|jgi:ribosome biogenesis GTPase|uniref:Small ribosomal subunit biogenesis GTPase RsgA n=1 Tax=Clostridium liquoris TaxID=1289519 RepID=A0A2T0B510_9CLOT|nr:ribosome small subunit-dependent GTPase A [Clostridium liquoris]PRR78974.1 putative ribosome biogenesis GTPase RsgA [Clostridium liquoris]
MQGIIIKGIGGFYYVKVEDKIIECKARGKFRHNELTPMVGDRVEIEVINGKGTIDKINERQNMIIRPAVANVTQALVVFALRNPDINEDLLNRFIMFCEYNSLKSIVCFNKIDLLQQWENEEIVSMIQSAGYETIFLNAKKGYGIDSIREKLKDNVTVLCGPSGVGKSTILNSLAGRDIMETGIISEKLKRGKQTTRHSELIEIEGGFLVDTPGFSSLSTDFIEKEEVQACFPEFSDYTNGCKFSGCLHYKEPKCGVKKAVEEGKIHKKRYEFYIKVIEEKIKGRNNK